MNPCYVGFSTCLPGCCQLPALTRTTDSTKSQSSDLEMGWGADDQDRHTLATPVDPVVGALGKIETNTGIPCARCQSPSCMCCATLVVSHAHHPLTDAAKSILIPLASGFSLISGETLSIRSGTHDLHLRYLQFSLLWSYGGSTV